jgi:hypothetical protein
MAVMTTAMVGRWTCALVVAVSLGSLGLPTLRVTAQAAKKPTDPATRAVEAFFTLDTEGAQFTEAGWKQLAALVTQPGPRLTRPAAVYEDWFVMGPAPGATADRAEIWAEGLGFGEYNPTTGRYDTDKFSGPIKWRGALNVVHVGDRWKVEGPVPPPGVTWQAALRHATALRDSTSDPRVKRNATLAVRALSRPH